MHAALLFSVAIGPILFQLACIDHEGIHDILDEPDLTTDCGVSRP